MKTVCYIFFFFFELCEPEDDYFVIAGAVVFENLRFSSGEYVGFAARCAEGQGARLFETGCRPATDRAPGRGRE